MTSPGASASTQLPFWRKIIEHPAYDQFWSAQALDQILAKLPLNVPTMYVTALYDQEDMYGGVHAYAATEPKDLANDRNFLVLGPWRHSGVNYDGTTLGPLKLEGNTALQFRREVMQPFLDEHLKEGAAPAATAAGIRLRDRHERVAAAARVAAVV